MVLLFVFFFFFKQKTAYEMRISDWSSDVCSSDLPGKEEFHETLRYFRHRIDETGVELRLSTRATPELLSGFDQVVLATGVTPRRIDFPGHDHPKVVGYRSDEHTSELPSLMRTSYAVFCLTQKNQLTYHSLAN